MSRNQALKNERDKQIRDYYEKMAGKLICGKQLYRHEAILIMASKKFYLTESWIERIVSGNNEQPKEPVDPNQIDLFEAIEKESNNKTETKNNKTI